MLRGQTGRFSCTFASGVTPVDPTGVTFTYSVGGGAATVLVYGTDAALVKDSTGVYHVDLPLATAGKWAYRWDGTGIAGTGIAAAEDTVRVERGEF